MVRNPRPVQREAQSIRCMDATSHEARRRRISCADITGIFINRRNAVPSFQDRLMARSNLMQRKVPVPFDFSAYKLAFEAKDAGRWIEFFADDAEWIEYRN